MTHLYIIKKHVCLLFLGFAMLGYKFSIRNRQCCVSVFLTFYLKNFNLVKFQLSWLSFMKVELFIKEQLTLIITANTS